MSMLDSFFKKGFNAPKCKTLLKLTIPRIKLLRNRREIQVKQMRRDIAKLLEMGQEATARIRVEHIIREENMMAAQEIIELFSELIAVRLPIIETQRECPLDLKEAISSICFAAPRCSDLPELQQVQMLFASKYGKEFVAAATELRPDCGVNRQIIELLSIRAPSPETKLKLLKEIAEEHELEWDPASCESEFFKPHEDLLNGPTQFISGSKLPLPKEKHKESLSAIHAQTHDEQSDSDASLDSLDLPEVPKVSLQPGSNNASAPEILPPIPPSVNLECDRAAKSSQTKDDISECSSKPDGILRESSDASGGAAASASIGTHEKKQFLPFATPLYSLSRTKSDVNADFPDAIGADQSGSSPSFITKQSEPDSSLNTKSEANADLQDVLAAAQAAAETAERAAAAARSAASLAQVRITELLQNKNNKETESREVSPQIDVSCKSSAAERLSKQQSFTNPVGFAHSVSSLSDHGFIQDSQNPTYDSPKSDSKEQSPECHRPSHQPQRSTSLEDDTYFSYPNLFSSHSQDANPKTGMYSDNSPPGHRPE